MVSQAATRPKPQQVTGRYIDEWASQPPRGFCQAKAWIVGDTHRLWINAARAPPRTPVPRTTVARAHGSSGHSAVSGLAAALGPSFAVALEPPPRIRPW